MNFTNFMEILNLTKDEEMMNYYMRTYGNENAMPCDKYLMYWYEEKNKALLPMFGNQLIHKIPFSYNRDYSDMYREVGALRDKDSDFLYLERTCRQALGKYIDKVQDCTGRFPGSVLYFQNEFYISNCVGRYFEYNDHKFPKEMKLHKALKKLMQYIYEEDGFISNDTLKNFYTVVDRAWVKLSQILNQKEVKGTLCLSIHPMDYMTMSDNGGNWSSCMKWIGTGEYRMGTIEMLNSPSVVVAYLESEDHDWFIDEKYHWNAKKWRELFIVDRDFICGIKGYPYYNDSLEVTAMDELQELAETYYGIKYEESPIVDKVYYDYVSFETNYMYNDIDANVSCTLLMNKNTREGIDNNDIPQIYFNYSGEARCICCGELIDPDTDYDDVLCSHVSCFDCSNIIVCDCCGGEILDDDYEEHNGLLYCYSCAENLTFTCEECGGKFWESDGDEPEPIYYLKDSGNGRPPFINSVPNYYVCGDCAKKLMEEGYIKYNGQVKDYFGFTVGYFVDVKGLKKLLERRINSDPSSSALYRCERVLNLIKRGEILDINSKGEVFKHE